MAFTQSDWPIDPSLVDGTELAARLNRLRTALDSFDNLTYTGTLTGGTGVINIGGGQFYKDASGNIGLGVTPSAWNAAADAFQIGALGAVYHLSNQTHLSNNAYNDASGTTRAIVSGYAASYQQASNGSHIWYTAPSITTAGNPITFTTAMTLDASGNLLVGAASGSSHALVKTVSEGTQIAYIGNQVAASASFFAAHSGGANGEATAISITKNGTTSRSINAGGTINASGADYSEYEHNNGLSIAKGSIVGFKADGTLTLTYSEAVRFAVKSTDPSYVGGDTWGSEGAVGKRPEQPTRKIDVTEPTGEGDDAVTTVIEAGDTDKEWQAKQDAYKAELAAFEARLEAARRLVDRIAYSGKVPCNVQGATPGDYIVATAAADGSITGVSVAEPDFARYRKAVGRVNRLLADGRCEVAVIIH